MRIALRGALSAARALRGAVGVSAVAAVVAAVAPVAAQGIEAADEALKKGDIAEAKSQFEQVVKRNPADCDAALSYASTLPPKDALKSADSLSRAPNAPGWAKARGLRFSGDHLFLKEDYKKAADAYRQASTLDSASTYKHLYALSIAMDGQTEAARAVWNKIALNKTDELSGEAARLSALMPKPTATEVTTVAAVAPQPAAPVTQQPKTQEQPAATLPVTPPTNNTPAPATVNTVKVDSVKTPVAPSTQSPPATIYVARSS